MATLTVQSIVQAGLLHSFVSAAGGGDAFAQDDGERTYFYLKNGGGGSITVTFTTQDTTVTVAGHGSITVGDLAVAVSNGIDKLIGPFPAARFNDSAGLVQVSYSGVTSVTVAAIKLPRD